MTRTMMTTTRTATAAAINDYTFFGSSININEIDTRFDDTYYSLISILFPLDFFLSHFLQNYNATILRLVSIDEAHKLFSRIFCCLIYWQIF